MYQIGGGKAKPWKYKQHLEEKNPNQTGECSFAIAACTSGKSRGCWPPRTCCDSLNVRGGGSLTQESNLIEPVILTGAIHVDGCAYLRYPTYSFFVKMVVACELTKTMYCLWMQISLSNLNSSVLFLTLNCWKPLLQSQNWICLCVTGENSLFFSSWVSRRIQLCQRRIASEGKIFISCTKSQHYVVL